MPEVKEFCHEWRIGYFSMEMALDNAMATYSGGLGVLAGDTLRSAADLDIPLVGVTLVSRAGYFRQEIDADGRQHEHPDSWRPEEHAAPLGAKVAVNIGDRSVWVSGWLYVVEGHMNGRQPVILLDTHLADNDPRDREITHYLYGGDDAYRLKQEIVLGIGGARLLQALGFRIRQYHMNEGHSALLGLELLARHTRAREDLRQGESPYDLPRVRELCCFTTHTPVEAGHDRFGWELVQALLGDFKDIPVLKQLAGEDVLNMTRLALNLSEYVNGVAKRHAEVSRRMFPGYQVRAVTNGVHPYTWTCPSHAQLYDRHMPGWCHEPELLLRVEDCISGEEIMAAHCEAKDRLLGLIQALTDTRLDPGQPILGFARRMTAYKRPQLLFSDLDRLQAIAEKRPFQIVMAGKAHPRDEEGKRLIEEIHATARRLQGIIEVVFLPGYDMEMARKLVSGADVWLNTPLRPMEASGTSGMKAALNGVPSLSVLDGWWIEGCIEGVTGWAIGGSAGPDGEGGDADSLYQKLEDKILPLYYEDRKGWMKVMKGSVAKCASVFNSHRMMRRYATEAYLH